MTLNKEMGSRQPEAPKAEQEYAASAEAYAPRKLTLAENVILTIKVFGVFALLGAALWGANLLTSAR